MQNNMSLDFSDQDLRGKSFINKNLSGADFSGADIRGVNFKHANLRNANFYQAKGGLRLRNKFLLILLSMLGGLVSGILSTFLGAFFFEIIQGFNEKFKIGIDYQTFPPSYSYHKNQQFSSNLNAAILY